MRPPFPRRNLESLPPNPRKKAQNNKPMLKYAPRPLLSATALRERALQHYVIELLFRPPLRFLLHRIGPALFSWFASRYVGLWDSFHHFNYCFFPARFYFVFISLLGKQTWLIGSVWDYLRVRGGRLICQIGKRFLFFFWIAWTNFFTLSLSPSVIEYSGLLII